MSTNLKTILARNSSKESLKILLTAFAGGNQFGRSLNIRIRNMDDVRSFNDDVSLTIEQARELRNELNDFLERNYYLDRED